MSNKILIIIIGLVLVVMMGMGAGLFLMWNKLGSLNTAGASNEDQPAAQNSSDQPVMGPIFSLDTFIVNLADKGGNRYLRVTMDLELGDGLVAEELAQRLPKIRDSILMVLPAKRFEDISSAEGKVLLRNEIIEKLNSFLAKGQVSNIYFKEFVVQ
jgi:flagellar FliL protein